MMNDYFMAGFEKTAGRTKILKKIIKKTTKKVKKVKKKTTKRTHGYGINMKDEVGRLRKHVGNNLGKYTAGAGAAVAGTGLAAHSSGKSKGQKQGFIAGAHRGYASGINRGRKQGFASGRRTPAQNAALRG